MSSSDRDRKIDLTTENNPGKFHKLIIIIMISD